MNVKWSGMVLAAVAVGTLGCASNSSTYDNSYYSPRASLVRTDMYAAHYAPAPELEPSRKISAHDCTKPFPRDGYNLVCR